MKKSENRSTVITVMNEYQVALFMAHGVVRFCLLEYTLCLKITGPLRLMLLRNHYR